MDSLKERARHADDPQADDRYVTADIPFRVLSGTGRVLGKFDRLSEALTAYNNWAQATAVTLGVYVVLQGKAVRHG